MNIRCPHCQTVFRVNPARIPPTGARAKCARCGETFTISPPPAGDATRAQTGAPSRPQPATPSTPPAPSPRSERDSPRPPAARAETSPAATPPTAPSNRPPGSEASSAAVTDSGSPLFGSRDPNQRAARIARALVSDIVAYHPERREKSLADGSLRQEFRDEILKSWDEYVAQVGVDTAKGTPFFRDALNAILAKGQRVF